MKKFKVMLLALGMALTGFSASAQGLGDLLKGVGGNSDIGNVVGGLIEGVFTKSDLTLEDLVGNYVSQGPAVTFKSDNFLQKAGGIAGAAAIESKLKPYYDQYGLTGMTLDIDSDANFSMKVKGIKLSGVITKNDGDGTFDFNLTVASLKIGKFTAYVEKSGSNLKVMFDADKLLTIISTVAKFTGNSIATTMASILESYDGACIGFKMVSTGSNQTATAPSSDSNGSGSSKGGLDALKDLLNKGKN